MMRMKRLAALAAAAALMSGPLLAQGGGMARRRAAQGMAQRQANRAERLAAFLDLTDAQKAEIKALREKAREAAKPIVQQMAANRKEIRSAVESGAAAAVLQKLAAAQGALQGQLMAIRLSTQVKVRAVLTPEQRDKLEKLRGLAAPGGRGARRGLLEGV